MESTFAQIQENNERYKQSEYEVTLYEVQITKYKEQMEFDKEAHKTLNEMRTGLSRKIAEAEISYMRTEQIFDLVMKYAAKVRERLGEIN
jgi:phage-related tail protein